MQVQLHPETIGERLAYIRSGTRLTQRQFADRLGISLRAYQAYERNESEVPSGVLLSVYREFEIRPLWLLAGIEKEPPDDVRWTVEILKTVEDATANLMAILARSKVKLEPGLTGRLVAHLAQYEITEDEKIVEALRLAGVTTGRKQR